MSKSQFLSENLQDGEVYVGFLPAGEGEPDAHIFLLPGEASDVNWKDAVQWAKKAGGELPTRRQQAMLYASCKAHFQPRWYWSGEQHAGDTDYAWTQLFLNGTQGYYDESASGRARAVRRLVIL